MRRRANRLLACAACAAIAGIGGTVIGLRIFHLVQFNDKFLSKPVAAHAEDLYKQELCLFHAIRTDVPRGAGVYLAGNNVAYAQRLAELSTLWATPTQQRRTAEWALTITKLETSPRPQLPRGTRQYRCYGDLLVVRQI